MDDDENLRVFTPVPSTVPFFTGSKFVNLICGPVGSTKTTAGLMKIAYEASKVAPCKDGLRRSRCVVVRNTRQMLDDTTIPDFLKWFPEGQAGVFLRTGSKFVLRFDDVECEVLFRGLDDTNDVRRLLSLQLTFGVMDEFREIHKDIFESLQARVGRYPDKSMNGVGCKDEAGNQVDKVWGMTNPPDEGSFWEEYMTSPPPNAQVSIQPSGLSPDADWLHLLKDGYYENLAQGKSEEYVDVYIHAKFGRSLSGRPVFRAFKSDIHVAKSPLKALNSTERPLIIGVDAGLSPAAVLTQVDYRGRLLVYGALISEGMGALRFVREVLKPELANRFPGFNSVVIIDPAAFQRAQTDERTVADIYRQEGFVVKPARTNSIASRLAAVDNYLTRLVDGDPLFLVDGEHAKPLVLALNSKYRYRIKTTGEVEDKPEKSHPWSDVCLTAGTLVRTVEGDVPIETVRVGDVVLTHVGARRVTAAGHRDAQPTVTVHLSNGVELCCTPDHPFAVGDKTHPCYLPADALTSASKLLHVEDALWANGHNHTRSGRWSLSSAGFVAKSLRRLSGVLTKVRGSIVRGSATRWQRGLPMGSRSMGCGSAGQARTGTIGTSVQISPLYRCISMCGKNIGAKCQMGLSSTTSTTTLRTTISRILSLWTPATMQDCTLCGVSSQALSIPQPLSNAHVRLRSCGTGHKKAGSGTDSTPFVLRVSAGEMQRVYNLTVDGEHTYYANGVLVHNCDAMQYACLFADQGGIIGAGTHTVKALEVSSVSAAGWT